MVMTLLKYIAKLRKTRGALSAFSKRAGLEQSSLRRLEWRILRGDRDMKVSTALKIRDASGGVVSTLDDFK